jgi:AraC-like DNA-binding protein
MKFKKRTLKWAMPISLTTSGLSLLWLLDEEKYGKDRYYLLLGYFLVCLIFTSLYIATHRKVEKLSNFVTPLIYQTIYPSSRLNKNTTKSDKTKRHDDAFIEKATRLILQNSSDVSFDVDSLGLALCMGHTKTAQEIKRITGLSPHQFIIKVKMDEALRLLTESPSLPISDIALQLGYSISGFNNVFKRYFKISPREARTRVSST